MDNEFPIAPDTEMPESTKSIKVARDFAQWWLGDPQWANQILWAYNNPEEAKESLKQEGMYDE